MAHARIEFDRGHVCEAGPGILTTLAQQSWMSGTGSLPASAVAGAAPRSASAAFARLAERQVADLVPLLKEMRAAGERPTQIRLTGFGDLRIQCEFAHLCGEVEHSKPPEPPAKTEGGQLEKAAEPFVPRPLRPAPSSSARQAIERALSGVRWIQEATYLEFHTRAEFNGPRKLFLSLTPSAQEAVRLEDLIGALRGAGFPPTALEVSRLFPGIPFGHPLPGDLELVTPGGERRTTGSLERPGRPLALAFISLHCPRWDKHRYQAEAAHYRQLAEIAGAFEERVDFVAVSANPDDRLPEVAGLLEQAGLRIPLLHDPEGKTRAALNAQITPAPHLFVFDGEGRLRYAGEAHDQWEKPGEARKDFLGPALEQVLGKRFAPNGAVFFNSPKCNCSSPECKCPRCGCGSSCRCGIKH